MSLFEKATRQKLRFKVVNGFLNTEELWDVKLEMLDKIAIDLNKEIKETNEQSFIKTKTSANTTLDLKFEVVKYIITVKLEEEEAKKVAKEKRLKKEQLLELLAQKENEALGAKSIEEIKQELMALEA